MTHMPSYEEYGDLYSEAVDSLERIASHEELPGDRMIVRNALEAFAKVVGLEVSVKSDKLRLLEQLKTHQELTKKTVVDSLNEQIKMSIDNDLRLRERIKFLEDERERLMTSVERLFREASGTPVKPG